MEDKQNNKLHIVMFPWLAMGHIIPFMELSKCLAQKGHRISFLSTRRNLQRLPKIPSSISSLINMVEFSLPHVDNLPEGAESTTDLPPVEVHYLKKAFDGAQSSVAVLLHDLAPDWILYDVVNHWLPPYAAKLGVSCGLLSLFNAASLSFIGPTSDLMGQRVRETKKPIGEEFTYVPDWLDFPSNYLCLRLYEALRIADNAKESSSDVSDGNRYKEAVNGSDVVFIRSCTEFEKFWLEFCEKEILQKPIIPVGLLPPSLDDSVENQRWESPDMKEWFDKQTTGSVVYIALGTEAILTQEEVTEMALGLELSELPFFWVLRKPSSSTTSNDAYVLPSGFENRTRGRGIVCTTWAPQLKILAHPSVGGFLTHCGWNSIIESLGFGCALVLCPLLAEQGLNARLLHANKIGQEIPRDMRDGSFTKDSIAGTLRKVMVDEEGETFRKKAKEMREIFGNRHLHEAYVDRFIQYLQDHI